MSLDISKPITRREYVIDYISPLICEELASASGELEINILPFDDLTYPTGLLVFGLSIFTLSWNAVLRALCYNVYRSLGPDGPFQLISTCQSDLNFEDDPGPGAWWYRVSAITPEGEGPLSPPATTSGFAPVDPPEPGECPEEIGTDTLCPLLIPENTFINAVVPDPTVSSQEFFNTTQPGRYNVVYTGGAFKDDDNPGPGGYKFLGYLVHWNNETNVWDPDGGSSYLGPTQANVEAQVPIGHDITYFHNAGTMSVKFGRFGVATNPVAGVPNPTFACTRTGSFPAQVDRVRIKDYTPDIWGNDCVANASAATEWDGTWDDQFISMPNAVTYSPSGAVAVKGLEIFNLECLYISNHPTNVSGCGWRVSIVLFDGVGFPILWTGLKGIGNDAVGRYYREEGCSAGPECLEVEEY